MMAECKCGHQLRDTLGLSYQTFVHIHMRKQTQGLRMISGTYRDVETKEVTSGDEFHALNISNDAEESYRLALQYFNQTLRRGEHGRDFVAAKWIECPGTETKCKNCGLNLVLIKEFSDEGSSWKHKWAENKERCKNPEPAK